MPVKHYLPRELPEELEELSSMALDLRWSWHHGGDELWQSVDAELWEATRNPWLLLECVSNERYARLAADEGFLQQLEEQKRARAEHYRSETWFDTRYGSGFDGQIAYFSMEFGLSDSLPIYSGGLGVLAGDHLKTASDLGVPVVGVGLLYQQGYFRQALDAQGRQLELYPFNDPTMLPVVPLRDRHGEWIRIGVELPGRLLHLRAWLAQVGRRSLFLLDSNDLLNDAGDRGITSELYGGGTEVRLQQEIALGIGGWRLLERLGLDCAVCHLNEGHAAFAILERTRQLMERRGLGFREALHITRAGTLFTTHTPVAAGFDRFPPDLFRIYFREFAAQLGMSVDELLDFGRISAGNTAEVFNMAWLAVRGAAAVNGVSRLHAEVTRSILQPLFPRWPQAEVPVGGITNGVHVPSWDSVAADALWTEACGKARWRGELSDLSTKLGDVDDLALWHMRCAARQDLVRFLRQKLVRQHFRRGSGQHRLRESAEIFDPDTLTLGFARRFTEYKRPNLLLADRPRLLRLLTDRDRPVQLVFAGKAHPKDARGKAMVQEWQDFLDEPDARARVVFIEDYNLGVAEQLVQGVDVWINTPRRPWEACGTSGMKVLVNGGLNVSVKEGWWAEAYAPEVGWALGDGQVHADGAASDLAEAEQLYRLLEEEIVPCFYRRDGSGLPRDWIRRMRESMAQLTTRYSSNRMLLEYVETYYLPLAEAYRRRDSGVARELQDWYGQLQQHWGCLHFGNVTTTEADGVLDFAVQVYLDELPAESVAVELFAEALGDRPRICQPMIKGERLAGTANAYVFNGSVRADRPAGHFTPRIIPAHDSVSIPLEAPFILWYR